MKKFLIRAEINFIQNVSNLQTFKYRVTKNVFADPKSRNGPLRTVTTFIIHNHKMTPHDKKERGATTSLISLLN